jgi:hypothetical protein
MMAQPAALYLTRFDAPAVETGKLDLTAALEITPSWPLEPEPEPDPTVLLAAEREAGRAEGAEAAGAAAALQLAQAHSDFEARLVAERQKWAQEQGEPLTEKLATALQQMQEALAETVGQILRPFIIEALRRQMMSELVEHVAAMAASHEEIAIKICGPADLIAHLHGKLAALPVAIDYEESEGVDVRVVAAQTMIETRLKTWIDLISARME